MTRLKFAILHPCVSGNSLTQGLRLVNNVKRMLTGAVLGARRLNLD
jgi:hypothetical protein